MCGPLQLIFLCFSNVTEIQFFCVETGYLVSHRLKKLCEQKCEDLALNYVSAFIQCLTLAENQKYNLNTTDQQRWFIMDIYIALLYKNKFTHRIFECVSKICYFCDVCRKFLALTFKLKMSKIKVPVSSKNNLTENVNP